MVHLQCHIGTDTLSLARLGRADDRARLLRAGARRGAAQLAADAGAAIDYVESELYAAVDASARGRFDLVYTGIGALCWLPDIARWAEVVAGAAAPRRAAVHARGPSDAVVAVRPAARWSGRAWSTRTSRPAASTSPSRRATSITRSRWHHPTSCTSTMALPRSITALMDAGMQLTAIEEHDTVPWNPLGDAMENVGGGEYRLRE